MQKLYVYLSVSLLHKTNRLHVAMRLFSNRSQKTSKCSKNIIVIGSDARQHGIYLLNRDTRESLGDLKKAVETQAYGSCSHSISRSPKLPLVFLLQRCKQLDFFTITAETLARSLANFYCQ